METFYSFLGEAVFQTMYLVMLLGSVLGLLAGALLIVDSARLFRINDRMARWVSTRTWFRPLEVSRQIGFDVYRRHRLVGVVVIVCALYTLYQLAFRYSAGPIVHAFRDLARPQVLEWIVESLHLMLVAGSIVVLAVGALLVFRPDAVRGLETWADRHYSGRAHTKSLEEMHHHTDNFVRDHPRLVGGLLVVGCVYALFNLWFVLPAVFRA